MRRAPKRTSSNDELASRSCDRLPAQAAVRPRRLQSSTFAGRSLQKLRRLYPLKRRAAFLARRLSPADFHSQIVVRSSRRLIVAGIKEDVG